ncbi:unnamed protein product [Bursaphelenchus okinawaensis]|uniref:Uncharacterized protein n=1 Tax=Bursaphelenchus okinawaensis TaxID=465554 RepID=A0A811LRU3_9BILA|nr:unnamed protein product [Bursaphelenchus okinawaensis]CAG9128479.1 unnamed protein product [Bursaphelenchus okinawaensis]
MTTTRRHSLNTVRGDVASLQSRLSAVESSIIKMADAVTDLTRELKRTNDEIRLMRMEISLMRMELRRMNDDMSSGRRHSYQQSLGEHAATQRLIREMANEMIERNEQNRREENKKILDALTSLNKTVEQSVRI